MAGLLSQGRMALHGRALLNTKNNGQFWALCSPHTSATRRQQNGFILSTHMDTLDI